MSKSKINPASIILIIVIILSLGLGTALLYTFHSAGYLRFPWEKALNPSVEVQSNTPEYLLAGIDKQSKDVSASELAPYTQVLDQLVPKCQESRMEIANMSASAQDILKKKGAKANNLELLNGVHGMVRHYKTPQKCESGFNMFVIGVDK